MCPAKMVVTSSSAAIVCAAATLLIMTGHIPHSKGSEWKYEDEAHWAPSCHEGKHQSPIALSYKIATPKTYPPFILNQVYNEKLSTVMKNNGHSAEVRPEPNQMIPQIHGGGLNQIYQLDHLHFHWQSEHTMEGYRFPLELHLVNYAKIYGNLTNALTHPGGVAVFAVLFDISPDDDEEFTPLLEIIDTLKDDVNHPTPLSAFKIKHFLPRDLAGYYRYDGSLTTPGCNEGIVWTVFTNTIPISRKQVEVFQEIHTDDHTILKHNYRSLQPLNGRTIYLKQSPIREMQSSSIMYKPELLVIFSTLLVTVQKLNDLLKQLL